MAKLLFVAHDIDIDTNYDEYVVPWQTFRRVIDDAFEIPPRPMAKKLQQVITQFGIQKLWKFKSSIYLIAYCTLWSVGCVCRWRKRTSLN